MLGRIVDDSSSFTSRSMRPTSVFNSDSKHAVPDTETRRRLVRESFTRPASDAHAFTVKFTHAFAQTRAFTRHLRATRTVVGNRTANNSHAHHAQSHYIAPRRVRPCNARNDVVRMHMTHCQCMRLMYATIRPFYLQPETHQSPSFFGEEKKEGVRW